MAAPPIPMRSFVFVLLLAFLSFLTILRLSFTFNNLKDQAASSHPYSSRSPSTKQPNAATTTSSRWRNSRSSRNLRQPLLEEAILRSRNSDLLMEQQELANGLDIECDTLDMEMRMAQDDADSSQSSSATLEDQDATHRQLLRFERELRKADFALELAAELARSQRDPEGTGSLIDLNDSPSALERQLSRKLQKQHHVEAKQQREASALSYCKALKRLHASQAYIGDMINNESGSNNNRKKSTTTKLGSALARFQQYHPGRIVAPDSILAETLRALSRRHFSDPNGFMVELDPHKVMAGSRRAEAYTNDDVHTLVLDLQLDPEVSVVVGNVLDETVRLRQEGYRPIMVNVGNSKVPGGDYHLDSATDPEADLFRRTTIHQCLDQEPRRSRFYPLDEFGGVYCPNQAVIRNGMDLNNTFMDRYEWISVVTVPSIPSLDTKEKEGGGVQFLEGEDDVVRHKILSVMKVGASQGHDALVLPPHGAELGQNPSETVAAIYRSVIGRDFMGGKKRFQTYKKIVVVLDPAQADLIVNETSAFRPAFPPPKVAEVSTELPVNEDGLATNSDNEDDQSQQVEQQKTPEQIEAALALAQSLLDAEDRKDEDEEMEHVEGESVMVEKLIKQEEQDSENDQRDTDWMPNNDNRNKKRSMPLQKREDDSGLYEQNQDDEGMAPKQDSPPLEKDAEKELEAQIEAQEYMEAEIEGADPNGVVVVNDNNRSPGGFKLQDVPSEEEDDLQEEERDQGDGDDEEVILIREGEAEHHDDEDIMALTGGLSPEEAVALDNTTEKLTLNASNIDVEVNPDGYVDDSDFQDVVVTEADENNYMEDNPEAEEVWVQLVETVRMVYERMLDERSLLIVKNRSRGLAIPEEEVFPEDSGNSTETGSTTATNDGSSTPLPTPAV